MKWALVLLGAAAASALSLRSLPAPSAAPMQLYQSGQRLPIRTAAVHTNPVCGMCSGGRRGTALFASRGVEEVDEEGDRKSEKKLRYVSKSVRR